MAVSGPSVPNPIQHGGPLALQQSRSHPADRRRGIRGRGDAGRADYGLEVGDDDPPLA